MTEASIITVSRDGRLTVPEQPTIPYIDGIPSPVVKPENVDMVVFRENTEDVYIGYEWEADSPMARKLIEFIRQEEGLTIRDGSGIGIKPISRFGTRRLVHMAIQYAIDQKRQSVTFVHKGNIMKFTEGAFNRWGYELAREEFGDRMITEEELWDKYDGKAPGDRIVIKSSFESKYIRGQRDEEGNICS